MSVRILYIFILILGFHTGYPQQKTFVNKEIPEDQEIKEAVVDELMLRESVLSETIEVTTQNGIVTLKGTTDNILSKEKAAEVALYIKGVVNLIEVDTPKRLDMSIQEDIRSALLLDPSLNTYEIDVQVSKGKVILSGTVNSWQQKELAAELVKKIKGVTSIQNNVAFVHSKSEISDQEIAGNIKKILRSDVRVDDGQISVNVNDGIVSLNGIVSSAAEKERAEDDAWVAGVKSANTDGLEVKQWARDEEMQKEKYTITSDAQIKAAIENAFNYDPRILSSSNIEIDVNQGVIRLTGKASTLREKEAAVADARNIVGVTRVEDQIDINSQVHVSDTTLKKRIINELSANPYIDKSDIDIEVDQGHVELTGSVDSYFARDEAKEAISRIPGIVKINNNLAVPFTESEGYYYSWSYEEPNHILERNMTDTEIKKAIKDKLWWSPFVSKKKIIVSVNNGGATLTGEVLTQLAANLAEEYAFKGGATEVNNNIVVNEPLLPEETENTYQYEGDSQ